MSEQTAAEQTGEPARLDDQAVRALLAEVDTQLAQLEDLSGPMGELALRAVSGLAEIYGQALARALDLSDPTLAERLTGDELIGHLLALHGIHPQPAEARLAPVLEDLRAALCGRGGTIELDGIDHATATARLSVGGCGSSSADTENKIRRAVLTAVPELTDVAIVPAGMSNPAAFVSLDSLMRTATSARPR